MSEPVNEVVVLTTQYIVPGWSEGKDLVLLHWTRHSLVLGMYDVFLSFLF